MRKRDRLSRRSIRLRDFDYSQTGAYFVTLCAWNKECLFGDVVDNEMRLNDFGRIVVREWSRTHEIRKEIALDEFCVMPNHIHGIISIVGANGCSPEICSPGTPRVQHIVGANGCLSEPSGRSAESPLRMKSKSVSSFIAGYKSSVTKQINEIRHTPGTPVWQRNYYERVIRNEDELCRIRQYIRNNPLKWKSDNEYP